MMLRPDMTMFFPLKVYNIDPATLNISPNDNTSVTHNSNDNTVRYFDLVKIDADNDKIKLGTGVHHHITEYGQPIAVLYYTAYSL